MFRSGDFCDDRRTELIALPLAHVHEVINTRHMCCRGKYCTFFISVYQSVATISARSFIFKHKTRYHRLLCGVFLDLIFQRDFVQEIRLFLLLSIIMASFSRQKTHHQLLVQLQLTSYM
jgi:hypothetical protein